MHLCPVFISLLAVFFALPWRATSADLSSGAYTSSSRRSYACVPLAETTCGRDRTMCPRCREKYWMDSPDTNIIASTAGSCRYTTALFLSIPYHCSAVGYQATPLFTVCSTWLTPTRHPVYVGCRWRWREKEMEIYSYLYFCALKKINVKMRIVKKQRNLPVNIQILYRE